QVVGAMKQFVNDHVSQFDAVELEQIREQRIVEEPETRKRDRRPYHRIVAGGLHRVGLGRRLRLLEVAAIRNRADDWKPPGVGLQRVAWGGHDYVHDRALIYGRDGLVGAADVEVKLLSREFTNL